MTTYITYTVEKDVNGFEFWGGADDVVRELVKFDQEHDYGEETMWDYFCERLGDYAETCTPSETDINDYVWFNFGDEAVDEAESIAESYTDHSDLSMYGDNRERMLVEYVVSVLGHEIEAW